MQEPTDEDARISFNAGLTTGSVFIDNVVFSKSESLIGFVSRDLKLSTEKSFSVYNVKGVFVEKLNASRVGDIQAGLNLMNLDKGLYVVKDGSFKKVFSVK